MAEATLCPEPLPSAAAAGKLVRGDLSALPAVMLTTAMRAGLIGVGMLLAGEREHVPRNAIGGALAIEAFVLGWEWWHARGEAQG